MHISHTGYGTCFNALMCGYFEHKNAYDSRVIIIGLPSYHTELSKYLNGGTDLKNRNGVMLFT